LGNPSLGDDTIKDFEPNSDRIRVSGVTSNLDTNNNGLIDDGDNRVDADHKGQDSLEINFTGVSLMDGENGEGTLTVLGVDHLAIGTDLLFV